MFLAVVDEQLYSLSILELSCADQTFVVVESVDKGEIFFGLFIIGWVLGLFVVGCHSEVERVVADFACSIELKPIE